MFLQTCGRFLARAPFLWRVRLRGDFELTGVGFTKEKTQQGSSAFGPEILGKAAGHVELLDDVAHFPNLT